MWMKSSLILDALPQQTSFPLSQAQIILAMAYIQMDNSSSKNLSAYYNDQQDHFANKYIADYSNPRPLHLGGELMKQQIQSEIQSINSLLGNMLPQRVRLGDFFSLDFGEMEKTLEVVRSLLNQRQKDMETKNQSYAHVRKAEVQKGQLVQQVEKLQREIKRAETQRQNLTIKFKNAEKTFKQTQQRLLQERDEYCKKYKAIEIRQTQYKNESRKQQATIKNLQERISRGQEKVTFKNSFEVMHSLQTYGPTLVMMNGEHQYNQIVARTMQENYLQISRENQYYKDSLISIQKQLQAVLEVKREVLRRRRGYDSELDSVFDLKQFKGELLNLPQKVSKEGVNQLSENVSRFKEALKVGQSLEQRQNEQKLSCVTNIKNLIKNYKNVVESQEQLLGKVILKAKQFRTAEMQAIESRHSKTLDEDEIDRARRFLEEQSTYLDSKNKQLEATRKAMQTTIRKVEQEREQFARKSLQASEEMIRVKKQVEMLPGLVQGQLLTM